MGVEVHEENKNPRLPTAAMIDEHNKTHLPYRNWRSVCVKGRGKEMPHMKATGEHLLNEMHLDFMFLGSKDLPGKTVPCLVVRERLSKSKSTGMYVARRVMAFLKEVGCEYNDIIVKSDHEPAIISIVNEVARLRAAAGGGKFIVEGSPVGSSASNDGVVERAINRTVPGKSFEARGGTALGGTPPSKTQRYSLACGVRCLSSQPLRGGARRKDCLREAEGQAGADAGRGVW